jgi:hypothetical protein
MTDEHIELSDRTQIRVVRVPQADAWELAYLRSVQSGEARRIVSTYQETVRMAAELRAALVQVGVITDDTAVDALLNDAGDPVLRVELTPEGMTRFERILNLMTEPKKSGPDAQVA